MYRILLIEDDNEIAMIIKAFFDRRKEMQIEIAPDGLKGEEMLYEQ